MSLYNELHRPQFHFSARENWINDPNGLVYRDGVWHLFFQHNPEATVWGNMTWGHAVSDDLMHWRQLEHALYPDEHGTMFSGSAVVDHENTAGFGDGALLVFYTAAGDFVEPKRPHTQCLAYSVDNGERWTKYAGNPVVQSFEAGNRDPKVVWHPGTRQWIMALYLADDRYCLLNSTDARAWTRFQDLRLEGEWHLWILTTGHPGNLDASTIRRIAPGLCGIAVTALLADQGFGFRNELSAIKAADQVDAPGTPEYPTLGSGFIPQRDQQMSIPVELSLAGSGNEVTLVRWPVRELDALRHRAISLERQVITTATPLAADTDAKLLDVFFTVSRQDANALYVMVRGQPMVFDWSSNELRFTNSPASKLMPDRLQVTLPDDPGLSVRLLIDKTSVEVFINQGLVSASFCFLPNAYIHPLVLQCWDGEQTIDGFELHELGSIWT